MIDRRQRSRVARRAAIGLMGWLLYAGYTAALAGNPQNDPSVVPAAATEWELGRRIYREGVLPSGQEMSGLVQGDVPLTAGQIVCESCHRRSGLSSSEGGRFVPPVSGSILYEPREVKRKELWASREEGPGTRPAYTDETLVRAIRDGVDSAGRPLDALMPRYALSDEDLKPLIAYMKTLSAEPSPGVTDTDIHFATLVTDGVDPAQREAMMAVLETY
ncbi:MAG: cytochrome C, partial [Pseudomonadota bacterium]|nr:cytochrome C [Pseudomonadota bacterium]